MTEKERIAALEKQVADLTRIINETNRNKPWNVVSKQLETELSKIVPNKHIMWQCKQAICCILGKSFAKSNVTMLDEENCKEAKEFIDFTIGFIKSKREKYENSDAPSGYERKVEYK